MMIFICILSVLRKLQLSTAGPGAELSEMDTQSLASSGDIISICQGFQRPHLRAEEAMGDRDVACSGGCEEGTENYRAKRAVNRKFNQLVIGRIKILFILESRDATAAR